MSGLKSKSGEKWKPSVLFFAFLSMQKFHSAAAISLAAARLASWQPCRCGSSKVYQWWTCHLSSSDLWVDSPAFTVVDSRSFGVPLTSRRQTECPCLIVWSSNRKLEPVAMSITTIFLFTVCLSLCVLCCDDELVRNCLTVCDVSSWQSAASVCFDIYCQLNLSKGKHA